MPDKKLTDSEIIKALECCHGQYEADCENCPNKNTCGEIDVIQQTLDLINRQEAKYEELQKQFRYLDIECERLEKENENLKAEVERLENHLAMAKKEIKKCVTHYKMACSERNEFLEQLKTKTAEVERLKEKLATTQNYIQQNGLEWGFVSHLEFCKNIKAEAYKEFAERLCEGRVSNDNTVILAKCLLNELVGDGDGK